MGKVKAVMSQKADWTQDLDDRWVLVDDETREVLDDAQGYGYKSPQKAYAAWGYKHRDRSQDKEKARKTKHIQQWMKEHKDFIRNLDDCAFEICKGSWGPDDKVDAKFIKEMLEESGLETDFTPGELLKVWRDGHV